MKKLFIVVGMFLSLNIYGQSTDSSVVDTTDLTKLNKIQLTEIYLKEVIRVTNYLPNSVFPSIEGSVPKSKYNLDKFQKTNKKSVEYNNTLLEQYREIIPYSDTQDLINRIQYLKNL